YDDPLGAGRQRKTIAEVVADSEVDRDRRVATILPVELYDPIGSEEKRRKWTEGEQRLRRHIVEIRLARLARHREVVAQQKAKPSTRDTRHDHPECRCELQLSLAQRIVGCARDDDPETAPNIDLAPVPAHELEQRDVLEAAHIGARRMNRLSRNVHPEERV